MNSKAAIIITYCSQCNWMLRASWMAQELLHTFSTDIASVTLVPGTGGIFTIDVEVSRSGSASRMAVFRMRPS